MKKTAATKLQNYKGQTTGRGGLQMGQQQVEVFFRNHRIENEQLKVENEVKFMKGVWE